MTKEQLIQYLRVSADLADAPGDRIAHVSVTPLRQAIALLMLETSGEPGDEPANPWKDLALHQIWCRRCAENAPSKCSNGGRELYLACFPEDAPTRKLCPCMSHEPCISEKLTPEWQCRRSLNREGARG